MQQGDTVTVTAYGMYTQAVQHNFLFTLASFLANLLHPAPGAPVGLDPTHGRQGLPLLQVGVAAGLSSLPQLGGGVPKGYLRVLVFNADSALVGQHSQQLSSAALNSYQPLRLQVVVPTDGYVSAYVGNESDVDVLFDDMSVEHRPGVQVQEVEYDPAGLELAGLGTSTPGLKTLSQYKFNGKEFQTDLGLSWNHQDWRFFDPQLLRWHSVDPEIERGQESWTPYSFGYDNAVRYADADGMLPDDRYYNESGAQIRKVENDKPDRNFVIKTTKSTSQMYGKAGYTHKGNSNSISKKAAANTEANIAKGNLKGDHMNNVIQIPATPTVKKMLAIVSKDNGKAGSAASNNREYGGFEKNGAVTAAKPGDVFDPKKGNVASISGDVDFHSHPSGVLRVGGMTGTYVQPPSREDIQAASGQEYVFGRGDKTLYIYDNSGVRATIPSSTFK